MYIHLDVTEVLDVFIALVEFVHVREEFMQRLTERFGTNVLLFVSDG